MTPLPGTDSAEEDRETSKAFAAAADFDAIYFPPDMLRAAFAVASEWRESLQQGGTADAKNSPDRVRDVRFR